ncbi:SpaA isopeptide-forming pilin-related protein [Lysinibacillus xylanilyticus]|uniref:SpaA isopeptide-forming pilin-related protein n=1 Tax=Lysinibacillus xylanilyticus TaxID=582475 RepID=UPI003CFE167D
MKKLNIAVLLLLLVFQTVLSPISVFASEVDPSNGAPETQGITETKSEEPAVVEDGAHANKGADVSDETAGEENSINTSEQSEKPSAPTEPSTPEDKPSAPVDKTNEPLDKPSTPAEESKTAGEDNNSAKPEPTEGDASLESIQTIAPPQELSHTGFLDSAEIIKKELTYGEQTKIHVTFSEKSNIKLKTGDTLTMTLPPELKGFNKTIDLDGYGSCDVTSGQVVCTFNSIVDERENIKGYFEFTIQATNVEAGKTKEVKTDFETDLSKQAVTITHPSGGSSPGVFFYKTGDIQPEKSDEVRWFLNFNLKQEELASDIVLKDSSQGGQQLQKDSFYIYTSGPLGDNQYTPEEFKNIGYGYVDLNDDNSFEVLIKQSFASKTSITVGYKTTITADGVNQEYFENEYDLSYQVKGQDLVEENKVVKVKNILSDGGAVGDLPAKGTLRILKHIDGNKEQVIQGVQFKVFSKDGQLIGENYTTNEKGIVEVPNLKAGEYYVQEVSAPEYVTFDPDKKIPFTIVAGAEKGIELPIANSVEKTSIKGMKTWINDREQDRPSEIKVDLLKDDKVILTETVTQKNNWEYQFDDLDKYTVDGKEIKYAVKEQPVVGYESKVDGYNITNTKFSKESVVLTKIDADTKNILADVEFKLMNDKGEVIAEKLVTDKEGQIKVDNLDPGKYAFVETKALKGYKLLNEKTEFTIENGQQEVVQITVKNSKETEKPTTPEKPVEPSEKPTTPEKPVVPSEKPTTPETPVVPSEKLTTPETPIEPIEKTYDPKDVGNVEEEQKIPEKPEQVEQIEKTYDPKDAVNVAEMPSVEKNINKAVQNQKVDQEEQQTSNKAERLPQTGESDTTLYQVLGLILVALAGCLLLRRKRKEI